MATKQRRVVPPISDVDAWKEYLPSVQFESSTLWIAEGDLMLDESELTAYLASFRRAPRPDGALHPPAAPTPPRRDRFGFGERREAGPFGLGEHGQGDLVAVAMENGTFVRWARGKEFTYKIVESSFAAVVGVADAASQLADALASAMEDWQSACDVAFRRLDADDASIPLFQVRFENTAANFLYATSFFPQASEERRVLAIRPLYFQDGAAPIRAGILRHELGHILGFHHESGSPSAPPDCSTPPDVEGLAALTGFDRSSVMQVFCFAGSGLPTKLSDSDRDGARKVYGPPRAPRT